MSKGLLWSELPSPYQHVGDRYLAGVKMMEHPIICIEFVLNSALPPDFIIYDEMRRVGFKTMTSSCMQTLSDGRDQVEYACRNAILLI